MPCRHRPTSQTQMNSSSEHQGLSNTLTKHVPRILGHSTTQSPAPPPEVVCRRCEHGDQITAGSAQSIHSLVSPTAPPSELPLLWPAPVWIFVAACCPLLSSYTMWSVVHGMSSLRTTKAKLRGADDRQSELLATTPTVDAVSTVDAVQHCRLLDVIEPIRWLILDYADDHTAVACLSSCRFLHAGYHQYPVKRAMSMETLRALTSLRDYPPRVNLWPLLQAGDTICALLHAVVVLVAALRSELVMESQPHTLFGCIEVLAWALATVAITVIRISCEIAWSIKEFDWRPLPRARPSRKCCTSCTSDEPRLRRHPLPRVQKVTGWLKDVELLPYLQHATELSISYCPPNPLGMDNPLPASLRTLNIYWPVQDLLLEDATQAHLLLRLRRRVLTSLWPRLNDDPLPAGVLPPSLTSLYLDVDSGTRPIAAGVLPLGLQTLSLQEWNLYLSNIALRASLTELDIMLLANFRLPALPPQLEVLDIGGLFNQPLAGVLPSSLRVLQLTGRFNQPLNAELFASIPLLEEQYLDNDGGKLIIDQSLPSLCWLRVNKLHRPIFVSEPDAQSQLQWVIVSAEWSEERVASLRHTGQARGFEVEQEQSCG